MTDNGKHPNEQGVVLAEQEALAQQGAIPPPYLPPAPAVPPPEAPPKPPAPYSPEFWAMQVAKHEHIANQMLGQVTGTDVYQAWQRQLGKLEALRELQKLSETPA